ncbi:MAG: acyl-CoA dehydrogenase [Candidatus Abyssubacteria bacterium]
MDFKWNEEQEMLRKTVRAFAERDIRPVAFSFRDKGGDAIPRDLIHKMRDMGLFGMTLPEEYGGGGRSPVDAILAMEEVGRVDPLFAESIFGANFGPIRAIASYGTEQQKKKYIPPVCRGEGHVAISITEPEAGSAATHLKTRAVRKGDHYVVNGTKSFISNAETATAFAVYCRFGETEGLEGIGAIIIDRDTPGFVIGKSEPNMAGINQNQLFMEDAIVPAENVLIERNGFQKMMMAFNAERCGNSTMSLVTARCAYEKALQYSQERAQFGQLIGKFQGIQWMLAEMKVKIEAARLLIYRALINGEDGFPSRLEAAIAKVFSNEMAVEVTNKALEIFGGYGYSKEYPMEWLVRFARGWTIAGGTAQIQRNNIAYELLKGRDTAP